MVLALLRLPRHPTDVGLSDSFDLAVGEIETVSLNAGGGTMIQLRSGRVVRTSLDREEFLDLAREASR